MNASTLTIICEFSSEDGDIGQFVSIETCDWNINFMLQNLVFLRFVFDLGMVCLIDMLCNHCLILLSKSVHLGNINFV